MQESDYFNDDSIEIKEDKEKLDEIKLEEEIIKENDHLKFIENFVTGNLQEKKDIINHLPLIIKSCDKNKEEEFIKRFYENFKENLENLDEELTDHFLNKEENVLEIINENEEEDCKQKLEEVLIDFIFYVSENSEVNVYNSIRVFIENSKTKFTKKILDNEVLLIILSLINSQGNELKKETGFKLIEILYDEIEESLLEGFVETEILFELESSNEIIRHESLLTFFIVIESIKEESLNEKFENLIKKLTEDSYIEIKQTLIKNTAKIITHFDEDFSLKFILTFFLNELDSKNWFVKETAFQYIGEVVEKSLEIEQDIFKEATPLLKLILIFLDLPNSIENINILLQEKIICSNVGFLYEVLLVYPKEAEYEQLKQYLEFVENLNEEIKIKFKSEIAEQFKNLIKLCNAEEELQIIDFIKSNYLNTNLKYSNKIREKIVNDFHLFLFELPVEQRNEFAEFYISILDNEEMQWRLKFAITNIFNNLFTLFDQETIYEEILPIVFSLCRDNCYEVRKNTCLNFYEIFLLLKEDSEFLEMFKENLVSLANYNWFNIWESFLFIFQGILENCYELMPDFIMNLFETFLNEQVLNNQNLLLDILISNHKIFNENENEEIKKILEIFEEENSIEILEKLEYFYELLENNKKIHKLTFKIKQKENLHILNNQTNSDSSFSSADSSFYQEKKYTDIYL